LFKDEELHNVLVVGGWRNEEKEGAGQAPSPLGAAIADLERARAAAVQRIALQPLPEASVNRLLAATLHSDPAATEPLARTIHHKTAGNPFFVHELLRMLHRDGAFRLDAEHGRWSWDASEIE